jgi:hypothetical protein
MITSSTDIFLVAIPILILLVGLFYAILAIIRAHHQKKLGSLIEGSIYWFIFQFLFVVFLPKLAPSLSIIWLFGSVPISLFLAYWFFIQTRTWIASGIITAIVFNESILFGLILTGVLHNDSSEGWPVFIVILNLPFFWVLYQLLT